MTGGYGDYIRSVKELNEANADTVQKKIVDDLLGIIEQLELEIEELKNPSYCLKCGSCGETGCCQPLCMYGENHQADYKELNSDCNKYYNALKNIRKRCFGDSAFGKYIDKVLE